MITQRLANKYPLWSTLRSDPSSNGYRLLDSFREGFERATEGLRKWLDCNYLMTHDLGVGTIYQVELEERLPVTIGAGGLQTFDIPTVIGDGYDVVNVPYEEEFFYPTVDRVSLLEEVELADNILVVPVVLTTPNQLCIEVSGSTEYFDRTATENRYSNNLYFVQIEGVDLNNNEVSETVNIRDDGVYYSALIYSEVTAIRSEGFDGTVTVRQFHTDTSYKRHPFKTVVFQDFEGPAHLSLSTEVLYAETVSFLRLFTKEYKDGSRYRDGGNTEENDYTFADLVLRDSGGNHLELIDFAISPRKGEIYAVTTTGLYVYDLDFGFVAPETNKTRGAAILIVPSYPYPKYGSEESVLTWFRNPVEPIATVQIKRILPDATVEYLQANETWNPVPYIFSGKEAKLVPNTWSDLKFFSEYDQVGQWEYVLTSKDRTATEEVFVSNVLVPHLDAKRVIDLDFVEGDITGVYFDSDGILCIRADSIYRCNEHFDVFLIDRTGEILYTRENYDAVSVA